MRPFATMAVLMLMLPALAGCAEKEMSDTEYRALVVDHNNEVKTTNEQVKAVGDDVRAGSKSYGDAASVARQAEQETLGIKASFEQVKEPATWSKAKPYFTEAYGHFAAAFGHMADCYEAGDMVCIRGSNAIDAANKALQAGVSNAPPKPT